MADDATPIEPATRQLWGGLHLLDRQLVDRNGVNCGNVDDVELEVGPDGYLHVTAILSGSGYLARRLGMRRFGDWLRWAYARLDPRGDGTDPARIPLRLVADIGGSKVRTSLDADQVGANHTERWMRDHVIERLRGSGHAPG